MVGLNDLIPTKMILWSVSGHRTTDLESLPAGDILGQILQLSSSSPWDRFSPSVLLCMVMAHLCFVIVKYRELFRNTQVPLFSCHQGPMACFWFWLRVPDVPESIKEWRRNMGSVAWQSSVVKTTCTTPAENTGKVAIWTQLWNIAGKIMKTWWVLTSN